MKQRRDDIPQGSTSYYVVLPILQTQPHLKGKGGDKEKDPQNILVRTFKLAKADAGNVTKYIHRFLPSDDAKYRIRLRTFLEELAMKFNNKAPNFPQCWLDGLHLEDWNYAQAALVFNVEYFLLNLTAELKTTLRHFYIVLLPCIDPMGFIITRTGKNRETVFKRFPRIWEDEPVYEDGMPLGTTQLTDSIQTFLPVSEHRMALHRRIVDGPACQIMIIPTPNPGIGSKEYTKHVSEIFKRIQTKPLPSTADELPRRKT